MKEMTLLSFGIRIWLSAYFQKLVMLRLLAFFCIVMITPTISNKVYIQIQEPDIKPLRIDKEINDVRSSIECVTICLISENCVGGRQIIEMNLCQITIETSGIMPYFSNKTATEKDTVFGLLCKSTGYVTTVQRYISGHNDRIINRITNIASCRAECSKYVWCLSADVNRAGCYLAGVERSHVSLSSLSQNDHISSSKICAV